MSVVQLLTVVALLYSSAEGFKLMPVKAEVECTDVNPKVDCGELLLPKRFSNVLLDFCALDCRILRN